MCSRNDCTSPLSWEPLLGAGDRDQLFPRDEGEAVFPGTKSRVEVEVGPVVVSVIREISVACML